MPVRPARQCLLILLLLLPAVYGSAQEGRFFLYEDVAGNLAPDSAAALWQSGRFEPVARAKNIGFTRSIYWLACEADLDEDFLNEKVLVVGDVHINRLHVYDLDVQNNPTLLFETGDYYPFSQRPLPATHYLFPVIFRGGWTSYPPLSALGKAQGPTARMLVRVDKANESLQLSFAVKNKTGALAEDSRDTAVFALLTGGILLLLFFGVYLVLITRDPVYLMYVFYLLAGWCWVLANSGHGFRFLWPQLEWFASKARPVFTLATAGLSIHFMLHYIDATRSRILHRVVKGMSIFLGASILMVLLLPGVGYNSAWWMYLQFLLPVIVLLYIGFAFVMLAKQAIKGNQLAIFYLVAVLALLLFAILQLAFYTGRIQGEAPFLARYGMAIGYVMESIILTAGLTYRFNQYKKERENLLVEMNRRQAENTRILMEVQEAERSQVANQLHDVAGSLLSAARLNLSAMREKLEKENAPVDIRLQTTEEAINEVSHTVRNLSHALSPVMLQQVGFPKALEKVIALFNAAGKIKVELLVSGFESYDPLLANYYTAFYGILYELMNNITKHSGATHALVQVAEMEDCFTMIVEDNGIGFSGEAVAGTGTLGLSGVYSKIDYFKGHIAIERNVPNGTLITIEIPRS